MQKTLRKTTVALSAFVLMLTIVSVTFTAVSFAQEGPRSYTNPVPSWKGWQGVYTGPSPPPSPWYGTSIGCARYNASNANYNPASPAPDTSHLLWIHQYGMGGVITTVNDPGYGIEAGDFFSDIYNDVIAIGGLVFTGRGDGGFGSPGIMTCLDEETGEIVWETRLNDPETGAPIPLHFLAPNYAIRMPPSERGPAYPRIDIYTFTSIYEVSTVDGAVIAHYEFPHQPLGWYYSDELKELGYENGVVFCQSFDGYIYAYEAMPSSDEPANLIWGPARSTVGTGISTIHNDVIVTGYAQMGRQIGIDTTTGENLWEIAVTTTCEAFGAGYGMLYVPMTDGYRAYDIRTGDLVWSNTDITPSYWAEFSELIGDGVVANADVAGRVYAFDAFDGELLWSFEAGVCQYEHYKSWYGTWPFHYAPIGADGKLYLAPGDDIPGQDVPGQYLYCLDLHTGELLWKYPAAQFGHTDVGAIADGLLFEPSTLTNQLLCFGQGQTAVEISTDVSRIAKGDYTWITGTVTDQSPAQPGTPVVSKEDMDEWMGYLHAGLPAPDKVTGVPVTLYATRSSDETVFELGTVITDGGYGTFALNWIPPDDDLYTITAVFTGDESYYGSFASTYLTVEPIVGSTSTTVTGVMENATINPVTMVAVVMAACIVMVNLAVIMMTRRHRGGIEK